MAGRLLLVGTAHVLELALPLERVLRTFDPDVVALELDRERWAALRAPVRPRRGPLLLRLLASLQERLGEMLGAPPGSDMLAAGRTAQWLGVRVALVDLPVGPTLQRAWRALDWRERLALVRELAPLLAGADLLMTGPATADNPIATGDFSRELAEFAHRFPSLQRELIDRRDRYMARRLVALLRDGQRVAAVVGEGHLAGLARRLDRVSPQVVPLSRLLELGRQA
ncbi:MAG: TraB domain-containing protein [Candidatus Poseidoniia archaeon]|nr:TraB domain-containing protein [Candidatus Poseidoniia archaeon]